MRNNKTVNKYATKRSRWVWRKCKWRAQILLYQYWFLCNFVFILENWSSFDTNVYLVETHVLIYFAVLLMVSLQASYNKSIWNLKYEYYVISSITKLHNLRVFKYWDLFYSIIEFLTEIYKCNGNGNIILYETSMYVCVCTNININKKILINI